MTTYEIPMAVGEALIDNTLQAVRQMGQVHEHGEKVARVMLDQSRQTREIGQKMAQSWADQARENNKQIQTLVHNSVRMSLEGFRTAQQQTIDELTRQVQRLTQQVESLTAKATAKV